jgi:hypothetical protein
MVETDLASEAPALSRIVLTVDPATPVRAVAERYAVERQRLLGKRPRDLSQKHRELARYLMRHGELGQWADLMQAWNAAWAEEHPEWPYTLAGTFARDCQQARRRLLGADWLAAVSSSAASGEMAEPPEDGAEAGAEDIIDDVDADDPRDE